MSSSVITDTDVVVALHKKMYIWETWWEFDTVWGLGQGK